MDTIIRKYNHMAKKKQENYKQGHIIEWMNQHSLVSSLIYIYDYHYQQNMAKDSDSNMILLKAKLKECYMIKHNYQLNFQQNKVTDKIEHRDD